MKHLLSLERLYVGRTLALTVGSPSAHRRGTMLKHYAFMLLFLLGSLNVWGEDVTDEFIYSSFSPNSTTYGATTIQGTATTSGTAYSAFTNLAGTNYFGIRGYKKTKSSTTYAGIISTTTNGDLKSVTVTINTATSTSNRKVYIYGKTSAYSAISDLFDDSKKGTLIQEITYTSGTTKYTVTIPSNSSYQYVGITTNNNLVGFDKIQITWDDGQGGSGSGNPTV